MLPKLARVLGVRVEELLGPSAGPSVAAPPPSSGKMQRVFDEVRRLPRRQQQRVVEFVAALLDQYKRTG